MTVRHLLKDPQDVRNFLKTYLAGDRVDTLNLFHWDKQDQILRLPPHLGQGYRQQIKLSNGLILTINDFELYDSFVIKSYAIKTDSVDPFGVIFLDEPHVVLDFSLEDQLPGCNYLTVNTGESAQAINERPKGQRTFEIELILKQSILKAFLKQLSDLPTFASTLKATSTSPDPINVDWQIKQMEPIKSWECPSTLEIQRVAHQILHCPLRGVSRHRYLETKAINLLTLWLEQMRLRAYRPPLRSQTHQQFDAVRQIHWARDILYQHLINPPSLTELSRQVGLNHRKLNDGFRQVFQTTPFGYLRGHRLGQAQQLLTQPDIKVNQVAEMVGYRNASKFAAAFQQMFGMNPKTYQQRYLANVDSDQSTVPLALKKCG
ncbi:MAG: helix-turn-helix transcriptional regulator [Cyanothece sp. SIO1E1]|nr:helix-turn-helix transcriptional regulator [Cyanothece sp. SIO1E1]